MQNIDKHFSSRELWKNFACHLFLLTQKLNETRSWMLKNFEIWNCISFFWIIFPWYKIVKLAENSRWMVLVIYSVIWIYYVSTLVLWIMKIDGIKNILSALQTWFKSCVKRFKDRGTFEASKYLNLFNLETIVEINPKFHEVPRKSREIFRLWMLNVRENFPQILINANQKEMRNMQEWFERYKNFSLHFLFDR